jgi:acyl-CoA dehydrogenase
VASIYGEELEMFRQTVRTFFDREFEPHWEKFDKHGTDRALWTKCAEVGLVGTCIPQEYGGAGGDPLTKIIIAEELGRSIAGATVGVSVTIDIANDMIIDFGTEEQKRAYLPGIASGAILQTMAVTEPDAGSDATAIRTTAVRDGDDYVINGSKCFICNATKADLIMTVVKTDPTKRGSGMSVILVPADTPGVTTRASEMMGWRGGNVGEIYYDDVRVPAGNLLGREGGGLQVIMGTFVLDRLQIGARSLAAAELAFELTLDWCRNRKIGGQRLIDYQNTQFKIAEMHTELTVARTYFDQMVQKYKDKTFTVSDGSMIKLHLCELEGRVLDTCVQLFGGMGYMHETPISRMYTAARVQRIYAGTSEIQKIQIAKALAN